MLGIVVVTQGDLAREFIAALEHVGSLPALRSEGVAMGGDCIHAARGAATTTVSHRACGNSSDCATPPDPAGHRASLVPQWTHDFERMPQNLMFTAGLTDRLHALPA